MVAVRFYDLRFVKMCFSFNCKALWAVGCGSSGHKCYGDCTATAREEMSHSENAAALLSQMRFQNADAISKCRCDFKTQMRFQNADAISKCRCDFKTQMRFQNADAISKRRCDFKTQMRLQDPWVPVLRM